MKIWQTPATVEQINSRGAGTMSEYLGVEFTAIGDDWLQATMPVDGRTRQYMGILHGGASAFLAENVASVAANLAVNAAHAYCVGLEINANHLRPVRQGRVTATARPLHLGTTTQVWDVRMVDVEGQLCCIARMTMAIRARQGNSSDPPPFPLTAIA